MGTDGVRLAPRERDTACCFSVTVAYHGRMSETTDALVGKNLTRLRGDMSMETLAKKMREAGHRWGKTTVFKVEHGERSLKLQEAVDVLECLGLDPMGDLQKLVITDADSEALRLMHSLEVRMNNAVHEWRDYAFERADLESYIDGTDTSKHLTSSQVIKQIKDFLEKYDRETVKRIFVDEALSPFGEVDEERSYQAYKDMCEREGREP